MSELLIEIASEEIPARMQVRAGSDLARMLEEGLKKAGLEVSGAHNWAGPRRLGFRADIPARSPDVSEERKGPRVGSPEQALAGFMRGAGLSDISEAEIRSDKKGDHYVAVINKPGRDADEIVAECLADTMNNFPWPKSMKSGRSNFRWVRPLTGIICLIDGNVVELEVGGIASGNTAQGHRQHGRGPFTVSGFDDYKTQLEGAGHVILDSDARAEKILEDAKAVCAAMGVELVEDAGLLAEVAGLAEWPVVILGDMDPGFLELPSEVIRLSMRTHQKYFAVRDPETGGLAPHFVVVANQEAPDAGKAIAAGNSRVLSARLADAQFFQSEDAKKKLIDYYDKLDTVVFHNKLGSVRDKAERVAALARELAPKVGADPDLAEQAAKLAKCDLVTQTVIEFTSLQGQIGRLMFEREGGDNTIARAIEEHYKPQGPSDSVPTDPVSVAVALADKLDTLVGFWAIDEKPTGSKDPYALRRAALGVVRIILESKARISLSEIPWWHFLSVVEQGARRIQTAAVQTVVKLADLGLPNKFAIDASLNLIESMPDTKWSLEKLLDPLSGRYNDLLGFIADRLKVHLRDQGVRHDLIDAVFALGEDDLVAIVNRVEALQSFLATEDGENLLAGYKRASNILKAEAKKGDLPDMEPGSGTQPEEAALFEALETAKPKIETALEAEDYTGAMQALAGLRAPIDAFFDGVMVNSDDANERANRLMLLKEIQTIAGRIADFERIEG